ncbi:MAG: phosphate ABC transporter ATP-binding protein [Saprospiraceae bacterium]|nr:phosphate ABC transporter ATP-binding protein [Saprospiraceae bacterium]
MQDLKISFGTKEVLHGIDLAIEANKVTALIGPSGCGKSTLLRSINRMHDLSPDAKVTGNVYLDNENIYGRSMDVVDVRRKIGMVFQRPNPFPKSIFDNIAYGLRINGQKNKSFIEKKVEESLKGSYLWEEVKDDLNKSALALSGGQQQRLCIARTVAIEPEVILMDEPCSALDPISTSKVEELILQLKEKYTIVIVTHNMQQAQRVADYTAVMYLGNVLEFGVTRKIFHEPKEEMTKNYVQGKFG